MESFKKVSRPVIAGASRCSFIPVEEVVSFPKAFDHSIYALNIELLPGSIWLDGNSGIDSLEFDESPKETSNGLVFENAISGIVPDDSKEIALNFFKSRYKKFIVVYVDNQGEMKVFGTLEEPLNLQFSFKTASVGGVKGWPFKFYGTSVTPSYYVEYPDFYFYIDNSGNLIQEGTSEDTFTLVGENLQVTGPNEDTYTFKPPFLKQPSF